MVGQHQLCLKDGVMDHNINNKLGLGTIMILLGQNGRIKISDVKGPIPNK